jgi:hypothetical protein
MPQMHVLLNKNLAFILHFKHADSTKRVLWHHIFKVKSFHRKLLVLLQYTDIYVSLGGETELTIIKPNGTHYRPLTSPTEEAPFPSA